MLFDCCVEFDAAGTFHTDGIAASKQVSAAKADKADRAKRSQDPGGYWLGLKDNIPPGALLTCSAVRLGTVLGLSIMLSEMALFGNIPRYPAHRRG